MLLDQCLPRSHFAERHAATIAASPADALAALRRLDLRRSLVTRALFLLRSLPGLVLARRETAERFLTGHGSLPLTIESIQTAGFVVLGEELEREIVLGTIGRFWKASGGVRRFGAQEFAAFDEPGWAKAAWNFRVEPAEGGRTVLTTETRVLCTDERSRRAFRRYWLLIRPFSGLIRLEMLRLIRREAERGRG